MDNKKGDSNLWNQIKKGDSYAYHKLYDSYIDALFTFGIQYTNDDALVEDSIHDVFIELHQYRNKIAEEVAVKSYLFKSLRRNIHRKLKAKTKLVYHQSMEEGIYVTDSAEDEFIFNETILNRNTALALLLSSLTEKQRYALHLRFSEDYSYEEISSVLGITLESCRTLIYRSLKDIRAKL
ncbi:RNA polymerase sigma factor [Flavobacterium flavigenum]|uniref:RNA polymerase sigma factor n=1 Tax=Flavobacterium flavigenum TaxID=3003258 RepID=UPI0022AC7D73|nr:sigma-70 family RNA polymerase sigma factor [Flavobacterium flavigenum]